MASFRLAIVGGGLLGAVAVGACGLELGGPAETLDSGMEPDVVMADGADVLVLPDAPMDIMTPDLGTGETETGVPCTCTPALPGGWTFVAFDATGQPTCPMSYGAQVDTVENVTAAASTCTCNCNGGLSQQPTCGGGDVNFSYGWGSANNSCAKFTGTISCNPGCKNINESNSGMGGDFSYLSLTGTIAAAGGMCAAPNTTTTLPAPTSQAGRVCTLQDTPGTCGPGACVPTPGNGYGVCISKAGVNTCPVDFLNTHFLGDGITDTRSCGPDQCACTINRGTCNTTVSTYFGSGNCTTGAWAPSPQNPNGTCQGTGYNGGGALIDSCKYTSTNAGASCSFTGNFAPQGMVSPKNPVTVCCL